MVDENPYRSPNELDGSLWSAPHRHARKTWKLLFDGVFAGTYLGATAGCLTAVLILVGSMGFVARLPAEAPSRLASVSSAEAFLITLVAVAIVGGLLGGGSGLLLGVLMAWETVLRTSPRALTIRHGDLLCGLLMMLVAMVSVLAVNRWISSGVLGLLTALAGILGGMCGYCTGKFLARAIRNAAVHHQQTDALAKQRIAP